MANICQYRIKVRGNKDNCEAFVLTMPLYTSEYSFEWQGVVDGKYEIIFSGDCKNYPDSYTKKHSNINKKTAEEIIELKENNNLDEFWEYPLVEKSYIFDVEVWCCSSYEEYPHTEDYVHYCDGNECPDLDAPPFVSFINQTLCNVELLSGETCWCEGDCAIGDIVACDDNKDLIGIVTDIKYEENDFYPSIIGSYGNIKYNEYEQLKRAIKEKKTEDNESLIKKASNYWKTLFMYDGSWDVLIGDLNNDLLDISRLMEDNKSAATTSGDKTEEPENTIYTVDVHFVDGKTIPCTSRIKVGIYDYVRISGKNQAEVGLVTNVKVDNKSNENNEIIQVLKHSQYELEEYPEICEDDWKITEIENCCSIMGYSGKERNLVFPKTINNKPVIGVDYNFANNCRNKLLIESIIIPRGYIFIDNSAFKNFKNLKNISLSYPLERIGDKAFYGCSSLKEVKLPPSLMQLTMYYENGGQEAFRNCSSLKDVYFLNSDINEEEQNFSESKVFEGCNDLSIHIIDQSKRDWINKYAKELFKVPKLKFCSSYPYLKGKIVPGSKFQIKSSNYQTIIVDDNGDFVAELYENFFNEYGGEVSRLSLEELELDDYLEAIAISKKNKGIIGGEGFDLLIKLKEDNALDDYSNYFTMESLHEYKETLSDAKSESDVQKFSSNAVRKECNSYLDNIFVKDKTIKFGTYLQTKNDFLPIEWIVLERDKNKVLLLSKYGLSCREFDRSGENVTWEISGVRKWLNTKFINSAFNKYEQSAIIVSEIKAEKYKYGVSEGKATKDKVFLLNANEYIKYVENKNALCYLTEFAASESPAFNGEGYIIFDGNDYVTKYADYRKDFSFWWLRSHGSNATVINYVGNKITSANCSRNMAIRPAIWIDLNDIFFGGEYETEEQQRQRELETYIKLLQEKYENIEKPSTYKALKDENIQLTEFFKKLESDYYKLNISTTLKEYLSKEKIIFNFDHKELIIKLKSLYANGQKASSLVEIETNHPELSREIRILRDKSVLLFSMPIADYLTKEGVLLSSQDKLDLKLANGYKPRALSKELSTGKTKGRPISVNPDEIVKQLREKVQARGPYKKVSEIVEDNPELKGKLKTLSNISSVLFGTSLNKYLIAEGIISK